MSTPRLAFDKSITCKMDFTDPRIDILCFHADPSKFGQNEVAKLLDIDEAGSPFFAELSYKRPPRRKECDYQGDAVRVRYFGHACIVIQTRKHAL